MKKAILVMADEFKLVKMKAVKFPTAYRCDLPSIAVENDQGYCEKDRMETVLNKFNHKVDGNFSSATEATDRNVPPSNPEQEESDSAEYIDDWENEPSLSSTTSDVFADARHLLMVKSSPLDETAIRNDDRKSPHILESYNMSAMEADDREYKEEWRHSTLRDYLRESEPEVGIRNRGPLARKKIRLKKRIQTYIYNFLERPSGAKCIAYHVTVFLMVVACLVCSAMSTVESLKENIMPMLLTMEYVVVVFFTLEYCVRLWSAGSIGKYSGFYGRLRFARKPIFLLDLFVVIASTVVLLFSQNGNVFATSAVRGIRFLQILRILHMDRQAGTWRLLGSVVYIHRQELITTLYIGFLALILSSYFVYLAEKPDFVNGTIVEIDGNSSILTENRFDNYADALWWGVVTVTTIGYGDLVPKTWIGKVVASCFSIFAISFFALPAGILGSGFALKVQQKQRQKQFNRQIPAAATLIQACWRCYSTRRGSRCKATWKLYALPSRHRNDSTVSTVKLKATKRDSQKSKAAADSSVFGLKSNPPSSWNDVIHEVITSNEIRPLNLPDSYKNVVRALRVLIFLVRKKEFHQCRKPYDVRDVFEQYSHGYVNITVRLKELQRRLDQTLGKPASFNDDTSHGSDRQRSTTGFRLRRLESKIDGVERKLDEILRRLPPIDRQADKTT